MSITEILTLFSLGFFAAVPSSMAGLGGGFLIVPILILVHQLSSQKAVAISVAAMLGTTLSATIAYAKQRRIDYKLGLLYDVLDLPGVTIGAYLTTLLPSNLLRTIVGLFIMSISILLIVRKESNSTPRVCGTQNGRGWKRSKIDFSGETFEYVIRRPELALLSSLASGLVTGLAGLGGGITDTTTMILLGVPPHIAVASSAFAMALTNGVGVLMHVMLSNIMVEYALPITIGTILGAQVGSSLARRLKGKTLKMIICSAAFLMGIRLILPF